MHVITGDLWQEEGKADIILVTTNSIVNARGKLVMGRGAAEQAASRYPSLASDLGRLISRIPLDFTPHPRYGILILPPFANGVTLGAFQVKYNWRNAAILDLIQESARRLRVIARAFPHWRIVLNFPGIGNGKLTEHQVYPAINLLPDNVYVYKKE
jgi:hypothetical protein